MWTAEFLFFCTVGLLLIGQSVEPCATT